MKIYVVFIIILYGHALQSSLLPHLSVNSNIEDKFNRFINHINGCNEEVKEVMLEFAKKIEDNNVVIQKWLNDFNLRINNNALVLLQIIHGEALQDINERTAELNWLRNELCNEAMHLQRYRKEIEAQLRQNCADLENLNLRYTSLRYDVNLVNLENIKQQIALFNNSVVISLNEMNSVLRKVFLVQGYIDSANTQINAKLEDHSQKITNIISPLINRLDKQENYIKVMGFGLISLFILVMWQQYQTYCLTLNQAQ